MFDESKKNVVTIGGGTGTFVVLSGLKHIPTIRLSAIVSVADDGGSTGRIRDAYGFLPLGDARQALIALSNIDEPPLMRSLFEYRFSKGDIAGHNFGNLFLTALTDIFGSDAEAIKAASTILRVKGWVVPVSNTPAILVARLENGESISGEHLIDEHVVGRSPIVSLSTAKPVTVSDDAKAAIASANLIVLGPGDLYASTLANFAVGGLAEAVATSSARILYIVNLFTRAGQTENYSAARHVEEIARYVGRRPDAILVHTGAIPDEALRRYAAEGEYPVVDDLPNDASIIRGPFADALIVEKSASDTAPRSLIRHNPEKIAEAVNSLL